MWSGTFRYFTGFLQRTRASAAAGRVLMFMLKSKNWDSKAGSAILPECLHTSSRLRLQWQRCWVNFIFQRSFIDLFVNYSGQVFEKPNFEQTEFLSFVVYCSITEGGIFFFISRIKSSCRGKIRLPQCDSCVDPVTFTEGFLSNSQGKHKHTRGGGRWKVVDTFSVLSFMYTGNSCVIR